MSLRHIGIISQVFILVLAERNVIRCTEFAMSVASFIYSHDKSLATIAPVSSQNDAVAMLIVAATLYHPQHMRKLNSSKLLRFIQIE